MGSGRYISRNIVALIENMNVDEADVVSIVIKRSELRSCENDVLWDKEISDYPRIHKFFVLKFGGCAFFLSRLQFERFTFDRIVGNSKSKKTDLSPANFGNLIQEKFTVFLHSGIY